MIGKLVGCTDTGRNILVNILIDKSQSNEEHLNKLLGLDCSVDIEKWDADHSSNQRKYFHKLISLLARKRGISFNHCKNDMMSLTRFYKVLPDGNPMCLKINVSPDIAQESADNHWRFIKYSDGGWFYWILKGTSEMSVEEYNQLIDATIYECHLEGINTDTPEEIARLKKLWSTKGM